MNKPDGVSPALLKRLIHETDATPRPADRPLIEAVIAERLYRLSRPTRYMAFLFMAGLFAAFWNSLQIWQMALTFGLNLAGTLWFDQLRRGFAARPDPFAAASSWTNRFALASAVTGAGWGLLGWFSFVPNDFESQITLGFALCGLITLSVLTRSVHLPSYYTFMITTLAPPLIRCLVEGSAGALTIAFCGLVFATFTSIWSHNAHDKELRSAALRLRNAELLQEVDQARKMAEAARDVAEENYRRTLDSLQNAQRIGNVGNWDWDAKRNATFWSDQFYRLIGLTPGAIPASTQALLDRVHPDDRDRVAYSIKASRDDSAQTTVEFRVPTPGGEPRILLAVNETVRDSDGEILRVAGTLRDVTRQRSYENALIKAKAEAERASMAKTNFLGNLSHELRTPLNAVIGFAEILTLPQFKAGSGKAAEYGALILKSSRHLLTLIDDLLDIAQIEAGHFALRPEHLDLSVAIAAAVTQVQPVLQQTDCQLAVSETGGSVVADRRRLQQILVTLLEESIRLSPAGNRLTLTTAANNAAMRITLTSQAALPAISGETRPLHSFEQRTPHQASDLALRLAIMQELVRHHSGTLQSETTADGGTAVHLRLPVAAPA